MTEEEAKTKVCCGPRNDGHSGDADVLCIGSACMAWRLGKPETRTESCGPQGGYRKVEIENGYCGLAGASQ